jgi:hypothetical protein
LKPILKEFFGEDLCKMVTHYEELIKGFSAKITQLESLLNQEVSSERR